VIIYRPIFTAFPDLLPLRDLSR